MSGTTIKQSGEHRKHQFALNELDRSTMLANDLEADRIFDELLPTPYREISRRHWTSAEVVRQVATWLEQVPRESKIIDIGSGVGKFCVLLALRTNYRIYGIEQRASLHAISRRIRNENLLTKVDFIHGNMLDLDWDDYDILYLYNPFQEHVIDNGWTRIDQEIQFETKMFGKYTDEVFRQLAWANKGKILITYHGYGGVMPSSWQIVHTLAIGTGELCMWEKYK